MNTCLFIFYVFNEHVFVHFICVLDVFVYTLDKSDNYNTINNPKYSTIFTQIYSDIIRSQIKISLSPGLTSQIIVVDIKVRTLTTI